VRFRVFAEEHSSPDGIVASSAILVGLDTQEDYPGVVPKEVRDFPPESLIFEVPSIRYHRTVARKQTGDGRIWS
jgi:hypothetical protein